MSPFVGVDERGKVAALDHDERVFDRLMDFDESAVVVDLGWCDFSVHACSSLSAFLRAPIFFDTVSLCRRWILPSFTRTFVTLVAIWFTPVFRIGLHGAVPAVTVQIIGHVLQRLDHLV